MFLFIRQAVITNVNAFHILRKLKEYYSKKLQSFNFNFQKSALRIPNTAEKTDED